MMKKRSLNAFLTLLFFFCAVHISVCAGESTVSESEEYAETNAEEPFSLIDFTGQETSSLP